MSSKSKLFEFVIIRHPKPEKANDNPKPSELLTGPTCLLAQDEQKALLLAGRQIPEEHLDKLDELEIAIRPF